jgi:hypothetical protein
VCPAAFSLVLVEGCPKALKRYHKLMLRRIDWAAPPLPAEGDGDEGGGGMDDDDEAAAGSDAPPNSCHLVWEVSVLTGTAGRGGVHAGTRAPWGERCKRLTTPDACPVSLLLSLTHTHTRARAGCCCTQRVW